MKSVFVTGSILAFALAAAVATAAEKADSSDMKGMDHSQMKSHDMGGMGSDMHQMMMKDMKEMGSMKMTGDMDQDFAMMMRHHHQSGVRMAEMELKNGKDSEMKRMAQQIMDSQKKDIDQFDRWLKNKKAAVK